MSLSHFQSAVALLIRRPKENREENFEDFLARYSLTAGERLELRKVAADAKVAKFGESMFGVRWETASKHIKLSRKFIEMNVLHYIFAEFFEPKAIHARQWEIPRTFLDFLLNDEDAIRTLLVEGPPFILDLVRFERAQAYVWWKLRQPPVLPSATLLSHSAWEVVYLEHDLLEMMNRMADDPEGTAFTPKARAVRLLILPQEASKDCRFFEIDAETGDFLNRELATTRVSKGLPESFETLVKLGICREVNS